MFFWYRHQVIDSRCDNPVVLDWCAQNVKPILWKPGFKLSRCVINKTYDKEDDLNKIYFIAQMSFIRKKDAEMLRNALKPREKPKQTAEIIKLVKNDEETDKS